MSQRMAEKVVTMRCEAHDALASNAQLIELAAVTVQHGRITRERFHALVNPQSPIPRSGMLVHDYSNASLASCPVWRDVASSWLSYVQGTHLLVWHASDPYYVLQGDGPRVVQFLKYKADISSAPQANQAIPLRAN